MADAERLSQALQDPGSLRGMDAFLIGQATLQAGVNEQGIPLDTRVDLFKGGLSLAIEGMKDAALPTPDDVRLAIGISALQSLPIIVAGASSAPDLAQDYFKRSLTLIAGSMGIYARQKARHDASPGELIDGVEFVHIGKAAANLTTSPKPLTFTDQLAFIDPSEQTPESELRRIVSKAWANFLLRTVLIKPEERVTEPDINEGTIDDQIIGLFDHFRVRSDEDALERLTRTSTHPQFRLVAGHFSTVDRELFGAMIRTKALADAQALSLV